MLNDEKVLIIKSEIPEDVEYDYEEDAREEIKIDTHSEISSVIEALIKDICSPIGITALLENEDFQAALMEQGWMDKGCVERLGKIEGINRFFVSTDSSTYTYAEEISLLRTSPNHIRNLSNNGMLLQVVDKKCLKTALPELHKKVASKKKQKAAAARKAKAKKAEKSAAKQTRALAKARKLLEEAGEIAK